MVRRAAAPSNIPESRPAPRERDQAAGDERAAPDGQGARCSEERRERVDPAGADGDRAHDGKENDDGRGGQQYGEWRVPGDGAAVARRKGQVLAVASGQGRHSSMPWTRTRAPTA